MYRLALALILVVVLLYLVAMAFPAGTDYSLMNMYKANRNLVDQSLSAATVNGYLELESDTILVLLIAVPFGAGVFCMAFFGRRGNGQ